MTPDPWCTADRHGDRTAYRVGCRCTTARLACAKYQAGLTKDNILGRKRSVDATGTRRRIQALHALGWTNVAIADRMGKEASHVSHWCNTPRVFTRTATAVAALYNELSMKPGPSSSTRIRATKAGWPPPLAWDDDTIDDPTAVPYGVAAFGTSRFELEDIEELAEMGESWHAVQGRLGANRNTLLQRLRRANRPDIARHIDRNTTAERQNYRNQWTA